jgi:EAL domain-containing protein (putative c-di-GMP-specific phosphodiesterase class I)
MGPDGSVTLVRTDGIVVARRPYRDSYIGSDISASPLFSAGLWQAPSGVYETVSVADRIARIFAFRRIGSLPLIITVGVSTDEIAAAWLSEAKIDLALAFCAVALLLIAGAFLSKEVRRRESAESALSTSEERLRLALRAGRMIAWERDPETGFVTRSENAPEVLGMGSGPASEFLARVDPQDLDKVVVAVTGSSDGAEFREPGLGGALLDQLAAGNVPTSHFEVEVTETVFLGRSAEHVAATLKQLRDAGVRIALNDFGTGFASLTHLKQFPVDEIKIDRTFVRDMERDRDDSAIVSAVIGLGRSLGMTVVAEGVETPGQAAHLRSQGCHLAQGYLFAKPMAGSRVPWFLSQPRERDETTVSSPLDRASARAKPVGSRAICANHPFAIFD